MYLGSGFTTLGEEEQTLEYVKQSITGTMLTLRIKPASGYGDCYYGIYINTVLQFSVYLSEGLESNPIFVPDINDGASLVVMCHGNSAGSNLSDIVKLYFEPTAQTVSSVWSWDYDIIGAIEDGDDVDFLSAWTLNDLHYDQLQADGDTRGYFSLAVTVAGSDITVTGSNINGTLFTGTRTGAGVITLTGEITGSVTTTGSAVDTSANLWVRYPVEAYVYRDTTSPPTTQRSLVSFNKADSVKWSEGDILSAGNYYYALKVKSDTNDISALTTPQMVTVAGLPDSPTGLEYASGNAAATILDFTESDTVGATYNLYLKLIDDAYFDFADVKATAIATSTSITMPAITGYAGTVLAVLRAEFGGEEEKNMLILELEYDASGNFVQARPNTPDLGDVTVSGLSVTVGGSYNPANEASTATSLELFTRDPDDAYDFGSPDDTGSLDDNNRATMTATLTEGWRYVTLKSSNGTVLSTSRSVEKMIYVSEDDASLSNVDFEVQR